ncbi:hypothetical protein DQ384_16965 [Sphaerisporangium album]|uniref:Uncharacterized protein n=1 Tax=Sphaerisporangium album TaxID=509200 RepID=A0A367FJN9_9ACTN|nr:hypothetical protein DQ384_16965 [Sphaerisporangium album]
MRKPRVIRIRWGAEAPPLPLGCRWCGHPPYAHDASSLPHRRHHQWEQPTPAQMRARLDARRRLGLGVSLPAAAPVRPLKLQPPMAPRPGRHARPLPVPASSGGRRSPDRVPPGPRGPYQREPCGTPAYWSEEAA